jgi:hypothetical protein
MLGFEEYSGNESDPESIKELNLGRSGRCPGRGRVTGRPARTFAERACDHAEGLR